MEDGNVMVLLDSKTNDDSIRRKPEGFGEQDVEYLTIFPTRSELDISHELQMLIDFMIVEDISSIIDPRLSQVVLGRPFIEISNMTHDPPEGVVRFINGIDEVSYKMPHKIEQYNSLSDLEKEHTKSVYLRTMRQMMRSRVSDEQVLGGFYKVIA
ncbi:hypothetical protein Tco_0461442 [Tanacetum coccineum]